MFANQISHPDGTTFSYTQICEILGTSPNRMFEYNVGSAAVYRFKAKFYCTDTKMDLMTFRYFAVQNVQLQGDLGKKLVNKRVAVPCVNGFWQRKFGLKVDKTVLSLAR